MNKPPTITKDLNGHFTIEITSGASITWWVERYHDDEHWFVSLAVPTGVPVVPLDHGAVFVKPATH
jgi:hypothetical protein